jgi:Flp pilus assembly protein TadB
VTLLAALCVAGSLFCICLPFVLARRLTPLQKRIQQAARRSWGQERSLPDRLLERLGLSNADRLCQVAGRPYGLTGSTLLQCQALFALLCTVLFGRISLLFGLLMAGASWLMPRILLSAMAQQRRAQIALELPAFLDLWGLLVAAGEGLENALVEIVQRHPHWLLASEIRRALDRIAASGLFGPSLIEEAKLTGSPELLAVAEGVAYLADGGGVPSKELTRMAEQMREARLSDLVQSAGAMAIIGIFPKIGAIFLSLLPVIAAILLTVQQQI